MSSRAQWLAVAGVLVSLTVGGPLFAAPQLTWDPGATNSSGGGGTGIWNTSSWWNGAGDVSWTDSSNATFGGAAGVVTLSSPINANGVTFSSSGYTITGSPLTVAGSGITITASASGTTTISSNVGLSATPFFSVATGGTLALTGDLTRATGTALRFAGSGTTTLNTVNGTAAGTVATNNNGMIGGWAFIDNGNSTYSWATVNGSNAIVGATTSTTSGTTLNWAPTAAFTFTGSGAATVNSLIERADIHLAGSTLTIATGGIVFQGANFWMQDSTGTLTSGAASGELYVHTPNTGLTDTEIRVNVTNNGATAVSLIKDGPGRLIMQSQNAAGNTYTGNTIVNAGILELRNGVGAVGELGSSPNIIVNAGATVALNASDVLGFTSNGKQQLVINSGGTVSNITAGSRVTISNLITMTGGVLTGSGTGDGNGQYSFNGGTAGITATSDAFGNPSVISARISPQTGNIPITVNRGPANPASDLNINTPIIPFGGNAFGITKTGNGILTLNAANTLNGVIAVNAGTLAVAGTGTLGRGGATLAPGTLLDVSAFGTGGYNLTAGVLTGGRTSSFATDVNGNLNVVGGAIAASGSNSTLTLGGSLAMSGGSLNYNLGNIVAVPNGALSLLGTDYVLPQLILSAGTYNLFTYNSGAPIATNLLMAGPNWGLRQTSIFSAAAGTVSVQVSGSAASLYWRGGTWDNQFSTTSWFNASSGSLDKFYNGDTVNFDDTAGTANGLVTISSVSGAVQPGVGGINFSNTAVSYVLSGTGTIAGGAALTMNGPGSLTINNSNTYTGGTNFNGGLLVLGNSGAIGTGRLTISGGTLDSTILGAGTLSGGTLASNIAQTWNGDFTFLGTQNLNMGTGAVTLGSSRTLTVNGGTLTVRGVIADSGSGYSLNKAGSGALLLAGISTYTGATTVNKGTLILNNGGGAGAIRGNLTVNPGALVQLATGDAVGFTVGTSVPSVNVNGGTLDDVINANQGFVSSFFLTGGTMSSSGGGFYNFTGGTYGINSIANSATSVVSGGIDLRGGSNTFNVASGTTPNGVDLLVSGIIRDNGSLTMAGSGLMALAGINTYSGSTTISSGTLQLGTGLSGQDGSFINSNINGVTNNSIFAYNLFGNQTASYPISGSGSVTKLGPGQLSFNGNNSYTGTTTVAGGVLNINGADTSAAFSVKSGALYVNTNSPVTSVTVAGGATLGGTGSLFNASANVANGGILDFSPVTSSTFFIGSVTYGGSSTLNLGPVANFVFSPLVSAGTLTTAGQVNINANLNAVSVLSGTYDLLNYNSIAGTGTSAFHLASVAGLNLNRNQVGTLLELPGQVDLVITGDTPYWNGTQPDWLSTGAWTLQPSGSAATFISGDADIMDDSAGTGAYAGTVSLNIGNVAPLSVTFKNAGIVYTVSGSFGIAGSAALSVEGGGVVTLINSNSYTGATTVNNGILQLGNGGATGSLSPSSSISIGSNGQLAFSRSNSVVQGVDFSNSPINGAGIVAQNGPGVLIFTKTNGYTGSTNINGGTLQLGTGLSGQDGAIPGTSGVNDGTTLAYNLFGSQTAAYAIAGGGNLYKTGTGALTLTNSESYTGGTIVNSGTLNLSFGNGGTGTLRDGLTINAGGTVVCTVNNALGYLGTNWVQNITINGGALMTSIAANDNGWDTTITMTGGTLGSTVPAGYFAMGTPNLANPPTFNILANTAPAVISANLNDRGDTGNTGITFNVTRGSAAADLLVSGNILTANGGTAGITLNGNGITIFTGPGNTYSGSTTIAGGLLQLGDNAGHDSAITSSTAVFNNGSLVYAIGGSQTNTYPISGNGSVFMTGTGTVVLAASNSYFGNTTVNAGRLYQNGPLPNSTVTVNAGLFGGRGAGPGASVATGGSIEGGYLGTGTLTLGLLAYNGSGTFVTNGYANYPGYLSAAPLNVTGSNGFSVGGSPVVVNIGGQAPGAAGLYHLIQYSGAIGGSGFSAFQLGTTANNARGQLSFALANDPGYVDLNVSVTPVVWTGSLSTAWNANDTLPAPKNWSYSGSATNFLPGDLVQFDNSTAAGGNVDISNGNVVPGGISFNNDGGHPYTLTGLNAIGGTGLLVKNGTGSLTITNSNGYTGGTSLAGGQLVLNNNSAIGTGLLIISGGTLDSTVAGISLPNNAQNWNGDFTFNGTQNFNMGTGAVTLGSSRTVTVNANTLTVNGVISDGGSAYSLRKAGPGNLTLGPAETYTGNTTVNGGTLQLNYAANVNTGALASPAVTVNPGGFLALNGADVLGYIVGREVLTINDGTVSNITAAGRVTFQNTVTMTGGTISGPNAGDANGVYSFDAQNGADGFDATSDASGNPAVINATSVSLQTVVATFPNGVIFNVTRGPANPPADMRIDSSIINFGANPLTKNGNGILLLTGNNTYTGATTVNGGTLQVGTGTGTDGSIANTSGVTDNAALVFDLAGTQTAAYAISGTGTLTMDGPGLLVLSNSANTYNGGTIVNSGEVQVTDPGALEDGSGLYIGTTAGLASLGFPAPIVPTSPSAGAASAVSPVPEPGTWALLAAIGAAAASQIVRRKRRGGSDFRA